MPMEGENLLLLKAEQIAAHMTRTGEIPASSQEMVVATEATPALARECLVHGDLHTKGGTFGLSIFTYTPKGSNGKDLAPRYRMVVKVGPEIRRFEFRAIKSDDTNISDTIEDILPKGN